MVEKLELRSSVTAIPSKFNRTVWRSRDREMYKWQYQIENLFS